MTQTLVILKPDAVRRRLIGEIVRVFEQKDLRIAELRLCEPDRAMFETMYIEHRNRPFFRELISFMCSGPIVLILIEGKSVVSIVRSLVGATNPSEAAPGTIRFRFGWSIDANLIHASATEMDAKRETRLFFPERG